MKSTDSVALLAFLRPRGRDALVASLAFLLSLSATTTARAEEKTFVGAGTSDATKDWFVDANWSPAGVPGADDVVTISAKTVVATNAIAAASLTLDGATLQLGSSARKHVSADVKGDFALTGASKLYIFAGELTDLSVFSSQQTAMQTLGNAANAVAVGGAFTVGGTSVVYPDTAPVSGVPVLFTCATFSLGASAKFDAVGRGWHYWKGSYTTLPAGAHARKTEGSTPLLHRARIRPSEDG